MKTFYLTAIAVSVICVSALGGGTVSNLTQVDLEAALAGGGTVLFGTSGTLTLTNTITIPINTTLDANGNQVIISGGNAVRLFQVNSNITLTVKGLTLADGRVVGTNGADGDPPAPGQGAGSAAILNLQGHIILNGCTLTNNSVQGGNAGQLTNPNGTTAIGGYGRGAAISSLNGTLNLTNCLFAANMANGGVGSGAMDLPLPIFGRSGDALGGAIYCEGGSLFVESVSFFTNGAMGGVAAQGAALGFAGRAGDACGGALYVTNATLLMASSTCQNNFVHGGEPTVGFVQGGDGSGNGLGGALFLSPTSMAQISLCHFEADSASGGNVGGLTYNAGAAEGGHVYSAGKLQVWNSSFARGQSSGGGRSYDPAFSKGGAIYSTGTLIINSCLLLSNAATGGNAIAGGLGAAWIGGAAEGGALWSSGALACTNNTITGCGVLGGSGGGAPPAGPGGAGMGGGLYLTNVTAVLVNLTVASNRADGTNIYSLSPGLAGPALGGNLAATNATVTVRNSIIADSGNGGDVWGSVSDAGYNICSDGTANFSAPGSLNQADPLLAALSNNGGPTPTMALLVGSPARDAIPSGFPPTDQRGVSRPQGPAADIGAFEADFISTAPAIVTQPIAQTVRAATNVTFTVGASGTEPLYYQWRKDGNPVAGATASVISLFNVQSTNAGTYSALVTNAFGSATSQGAMLVVDSTPIILVQPVSVVVSAGAAVNFTVVADGPSLTYQWWHDRAPVPGGSAATLNIPSALAGAQGDYFVVVSNFASAVTSTVATLSFDSSALNILVPPQDTTAEVGYPASFSVLVGGVPPFAYQWEHNGQPIPGATSSSYTISAVTTNFGGTYDVAVTNGYRTITSPTALLTVTPGATPPLLVPARFGQSLTITFNAEAGRTYRLLSSTNLFTWRSISTNSAISAGPLQFVQPIAVGSNNFYRVVTP